MILPSVSRSEIIDIKLKCNFEGTDIVLHIEQKADSEVSYFFDGKENISKIENHYKIKSNENDKNAYGLEVLEISSIVDRYSELYETEGTYEVNEQDIGNGSYRFDINLSNTKGSGAGVNFVIDNNGSGKIENYSLIESPLGEMKISNVSNISNCQLNSVNTEL